VLALVRPAMRLRARTRVSGHNPRRLLAAAKLVGVVPLTLQLEAVESAELGPLLAETLQLDADRPGE
jgi:hypothetical protein